jgi:signal transduction histidine kinase
MLAALDELVEAARLEAGSGLELRLAPGDLVALTQEVVARYQTTVTSHRLLLRAEVPDLPGAWDRPRLTRVLENLLSNATKYSPPGTEVRIAITQEDPWAVIRVQDHGVGIPTRDLARLFEPFFRASNVGNRTAGAGLGLAGSRQIIAQHGGSLSVESQEGVGSIFTVRLPLGGQSGASPE